MIFIVRWEFWVVRLPFGKVLAINSCMRPLCPTCNERPVAVNYVREDVTHYRKQCDSCLRKGRKLKPLPPKWVKSGYRKKPNCEVCGFTARIDKQLAVFHVDGNLKNVDRMNLKTVCLNCAQEVMSSRKVPWKPASVEPDF